MRPMHHALIFIVVLCLASSATASDPTPNAFAYGLDLSVDAAGGLNALPLPEAVYAALTRADFGDLRVFNSAGRPVAHTLYRPEGTAPPEVWSKVAFFPLAAPAQTESMGSDIRIETRQDGSIVHIRTTGATTLEPGVATSQHILDLSAIKTPIDGLRLSWKPALQSGLHVLEVEASEDLAHWRSVVKRASVGALNFLGHRLTRDRVELPSRTYTYLRLTWSSPLQVAPLETIHVRKPSGKRPLARETLTLSPHDVKKTPQEAYFHYAAAGHRPTDRVRIDLPTAGSLAQVVLSSRPNKEAEWRRRYSGLAYHLEQAGAELTSDPVKLTATADPYWRLSIQSDPSLLIDTPRLILGWRPHQLVFAANDGGPFRLAYGQSNGQSTNSRLDVLLTELKRTNGIADLPLARAGQPYELGGDERLRGGSDQWKRYLLWGVMIAAVALIGGLAFRLFAQMKAAGAQTASDRD